MLRCLRGLFFGGRETFSLGRVSFWLVFSLALWRWFSGGDISSSHETILTFILAYNLGGKAVAQLAGKNKTLKVASESKKQE